MEQKFEKSFIEKFGDFYSKAGNRALFSLGGIVFGIIVELLILTGLGIGGIIALFSVYNLLSVCEKEKTKYIKTINVTLPDGKITSCALFEQSCYAYAPLIMAIFSPGFYIPHKKQYILVRNMEVKNMKAYTNVSSYVLSSGLLDTEIILKRKYLAVIKNPQLLAKELYDYIPPRREAFLEDMKPFFETELMEEIYHTDNLSICRMLSGEFILCHYENCAGSQTGFFLNENYIEKIKEDDSFLLESYLQSNTLKVVFFTNATFERLLKLRDENLSCETNSADNSIPEKASSREAEEKYIREIEKEKKVFTKEQIISRLKTGKVTWKKVWGFIMLYFSLGGFCLVVGGIGSGVIPMAIIGLPIGLFLWHFGMKNIKTANQNRDNMLTGQFKIIKSTCTRVDTEDLKDEDDNVCGYSHTHHFSSGGTLILEQKVALPGDIVYLVYLKDSKKINTYFNALYYVPADDLVIEECL